jgi:ankyrin repeat protein
LHWAIISGHQDTVALLISRNASLEIQNIYEGSALEAALWALVNCWPASNTYDIQIITTLINAGAHIHPDILPWLAAQTRIPAAKKKALNKLLNH